MLHMCTYLDSDSDLPENDAIHDDVIDDDGNCSSDSSDAEACSDEYLEMKNCSIDDT